MRVFFQLLILLPGISFGLDARLLPMKSDYQNEEAGKSKLYPGLRTYYFNDRELSEMKLNFKNGQVFNTATGLTFKEDRYGWIVLSNENEWYATLQRNFRKEKVHHSSFTHGKPVKFAGNVKFQDGKISYLNNTSGHFETPVENLALALKTLEEQGVLASNLEIELDFFSVENFFKRKLDQDDLRLMAKYYFDDIIQCLPAIDESALVPYADELAQIFDEHPSWLTKAIQKGLENEGAARILQKTLSKRLDLIRIPKKSCGMGMFWDISKDLAHE